MTDEQRALYDDMANAVLATALRVAYKHRLLVPNESNRLARDIQRAAKDVVKQHLAEQQPKPEAAVET